MQLFQDTLGSPGKDPTQGAVDPAVATSKLSRYERLNTAAAAGIRRTISVLFWARAHQRDRGRGKGSWSNSLYLKAFLS